VMTNSEEAEHEQEQRPDGRTAAASGLEARKPRCLRPRASAAPAGGVGMPSARWAIPQAAKVR
jgi:hypothetical protein